MPLDPLIAAGLASNILQFIDFTYKIVSGAAEIYKSSSGAAESTSDAQIVTKDLQSLIENLQHPLLAVGVPVALTKDEQSLEDIRKKCLKVGNELQEVSQKVTIQGSKTKMKSFKVAIFTFWEESKVQAVERRLLRFRDQLQFHILIGMRSDLISLQHSTCFDDMHEVIKDLVRSLAQTRIDIAAATDRHIQVSRNMQQQNEVRLTFELLKRRISSRIKQFIASQNDQIRAELQSFAKATLSANADAIQNLGTIMDILSKLVNNESSAELAPPDTTIARY